MYISVLIHVIESKLFQGSILWICDLDIMQQYMAKSEIGNM